MSTDRWARVEALFLAGLDVAPSERQAFLLGECPNEPDLRAEVLGLLEADERDLTFLDGPLVGDARDLAGRVLDGASGPTLTLPAGSRIGPWRLDEVVGEGGMGVVYRAARVGGGFEQEVALKLLKPGMDSAQILRRFEEERRILAGLEHENIARLLDGGVSDDGYPYFVMEYVRGRPIDRYCDEERLPLDARLDLFVSVCRAVLHAHSRLIVHRDLKPANILVTEDGVPKLLDFGIAQVLDDDPGRTRLTQTGMRVLTPDYASPEQLRGEPVGTASDIYALGVILYELLTGDRPLHPAGDPATRSPTRPSAATSLTADAERARDVAGARGLPPERLRRRLTGDLDVICLTALRGEAERRYATADALAHDIELHRRGLPVTARRDTLGYRISRFVSRNRAAVSAAAMGAALLIGTSAFYTTQLQDERNVAQIEAERATRVADFLAEVFRTEEGETSARELLDRGAERLESELADQPEVLADLREVVGRAYLSLGDDEKALEMFEASLAALEPMAADAPMDAQVDYTKVESRVAMTQVSIGRMEDAIETYRSILERRRALMGVHADVADAHYQLGGAYMAVERDEEAAEEYSAALEILRARERAGVELGEPVRVTLDALGRALLGSGRPAEAVEAQVAADSLAIEMYGERDPRRITSILSLAWSTRVAGDDEAYEAYLQEAESLGREIHPVGSYERIRLLLELAGARSGAAQRVAATELYTEVAEQAALYLGETHRFVGDAWGGLAEMLVRLRRYEEALPYAERAAAASEARVGRVHNLTARQVSQVAQINLFLGDPSAAIPNMEEAVAIRRELGHPALPNTMEGLGAAYLGADRLSEALTTFEAAIAISTDPVEAARLDSRAGNALLQLGDTVQARARLERALPLLLDAYAADHPVPSATRDALRAAGGDPDSGG